MGLDMYFKKINKKITDKNELRETFNEAFENNNFVNTESINDLLRESSFVEDTDKGWWISSACSASNAVFEFVKENVKEKLGIELENSYSIAFDRDDNEKELLDNYIPELFVLTNEVLEKEKEKIQSLRNAPECLVETIKYYRKHSHLHGLLEDLYNKYDGEDDFNCEYFILTEDIIKEIIERHKEGLVEAKGFFWGQTTEEDEKDSFKFFEDLLKETDFEKETVAYYAWY